MSLEFTSAGAPIAANEVAGLRPNLIARAASWLEARRHHRREMRQLQAMDAHMLADLGITRAQAEYLAQQPYAGDWSGIALGGNNAASWPTPDSLAGRVIGRKTGFHFS